MDVLYSAGDDSMKRHRLLLEKLSKMLLLT